MCVIEPYTTLTFPFIQYFQIYSEFDIITRGKGGDGQLGHGDGLIKLKPKKVEALAGEVGVEVTCGWLHTCIVVTAAGKVYTFGTSLGIGFEADDPVLLLPRILQDLSTRNLIS